MASLIEELIGVLEEELEIYDQLVPVAREKTQVIVKNDIPALQEITAREQGAVDRITALEVKRNRIMKDIKTVLGTGEKELKLSDLIGLLKDDQKEKKTLSELHDKLKKPLILVEINNRNKVLIQQSLELIEFNLNFLQSTRMSPGSNTYTKNASQYDEKSFGTGMFDAKQ